MESKQQSPEWFKERSKRLTASDFGSAAGLKKSYKSRQKLWRLKTGRDEPEEANEFMLFGSEHEPIALHAYEALSGNLVDDCPLILHPDYSFLGSSPDGIVDSILCLEIKCRAREPHESITDQFVAQCIGQLACTALKEIHFFSWSPYGQRLWRLTWSQEYWDWLFPFLEEFWEYVQKDIEPPRLKKKRQYDGKLNIELIEEQ